jgi:5-methylcytosine-specific restriction endonuclease McrA
MTTTATTTYKRPSNSTGTALLSDRGRAVAAIFVGRRCPCCLKRFGRGKRHEMQIDHLIPCAQGGHDLDANLIPLCGRCNASKRDRDIITWLATWGARVGRTTAKTRPGRERAAHKIAEGLRALAIELDDELRRQGVI